MPLTSLTTCYKTLPSYFADKVTQQRRKRAESYLSADPEDVNKEMKNTFYPKTMPFTSIESGTGSQTLTTKRSCTPLATVSDNESEDGAASRDETSGDTPRCGSSNEAKDDSVVRYVIRQQRSPRTAISLDNVDLWEEEESDPDDGSSPGFDQINGVPINPRSTIDFSELRRSRSPVASKRNRYKENPDGWTTSSRTIQTTNMADLKADKVGAKKTLLEARGKSRSERESPKTTPLFPDPRPNGEQRAASHERLPDRVDLQKSREPTRLQMPPLSRTYTFTDSNPALILATTTPRTNHAATSKVKVKELNRVNGRMAGFRSTKTSSKQQPIRDDLKRVRDLDTGCSTDSNMSSGSTGTSPERKVKFSSYVTVRQGEVNTYGYLRESQNSAQVIKQKYLGVMSRNRTGTS